MLLLRFRFANVKSFRDATELTMVQSRLKTNSPVGGDWSEYAWPLACIYGPNASGKSSVVQAIDWMADVIRYSATRWAEFTELPKRQFALDDESRQKPSQFSIDFLHNETRYEYGFEMMPSHIVSEYLYDYPAGRRRLLFEREGTEDGSTYRFGRGFVGGASTLEKMTGSRELFLSRGGTSHHKVLRPLFKELTNRIRFAEFTESNRQARLRYIMQGLAEGRISSKDLITLLRVADVGIANVDVAEEEMPEEIRRIIQAMLDAAQAAGEATDGVGIEFTPDETLGLARNLTFQHSGAEGHTYALSANQQSAGTLSWLSLALPSIEALRYGHLLLIDEIDASLHPQLAQVIIQMFSDRRLNRRHAQLIFTTHNTYFLSPAADVHIEPEEVWFVEKSRDGASELYSLGDFAVRSDQNFSRRYLQGRYGAVPAVTPAFLHSILDADEVPAP